MPHPRACYNNFVARHGSLLSQALTFATKPSQTRGTKPHGPRHLGLDFGARVHYLVHVDQPNRGPQSQTFIKLSFDGFWTWISSTFSDVQQLSPRFQLPPSCLLSSLKSVLYGRGVQNFGGNLILCLGKPYGKRFDRTGEKCVRSLSCSWLSQAPNPTRSHVVRFAEKERGQNHQQGSIRVGVDRVASNPRAV